MSHLDSHEDLDVDARRGCDEERIVHSIINLQFPFSGKRNENTQRSKLNMWKTGEQAGAELNWQRSSLLIKH